MRSIQGTSGLPLHFSSSVKKPGAAAAHPQPIQPPRVELLPLAFTSPWSLPPTGSTVPQAARTLAFGAARPRQANGAQLEQRFIQQLKKSKDPIETASLVDILGRAGSINAKGLITGLLQTHDNVEVRIAAARALGNIGSGTHLNSFDRRELTQRLVDAYRHRKGQLLERLPNKTGMSYDDRLNEDKARQRLMTEIKTLALSVGRLSSKNGQQSLHEEYRNTLAVTQLTHATVQHMIRMTEAAEEAFYKALSKKLNKPVAELRRDIPPQELEKMQKEVIIETPDGKSITLLDALQQLSLLKENQAQFHTEVLLGLMEALALQDDTENTGALKQALQSTRPELKARAIEILSERHKLNYNSDVYPNLDARNTDVRVRRAALNALLDCPQHAARQKVMELLQPEPFFKIAGGLSRDTFGAYGAFLEKVALNGDDYVDALAHRATQMDYDLETRQIALLVLGLIATEPAVKSVMPETAAKARMLIGALASTAVPLARTAAEADALTLTATEWWVTLKEPQAIPLAIGLAASTEHKLSGRDQERLLSSVFEALQEDALKSQRGQSQTLRQHRLLDILERAGDPLLTAQTKADLRNALPPEPSRASLLALEKSRQAGDETEAEETLRPNASLREQVRAVVDMKTLRPLLKALADSDRSSLAPMFAFRLLGLLQDQGSTGYLVKQLRDPLAGKINWQAEQSFPGNPSFAAANLRINALAALGDLGDPRALKAMTDSLDDAVLRNFALEPLEKLAKNANARASEAHLQGVRDKLLQVLENPNNSRLTRAMRISAAKALYRFKEGPEALQAFALQNADPNFKRHALSALLSNNHLLAEGDPNYALLQSLVYPGLGVEALHAQGITGKGVEIAIVDGGYVDPNNEEGFQKRVRLPAIANEKDLEHAHPTMVMSTAAGNGKIKGVAPDAVAYSDRWPEFDGEDTMDVYKKIIEGKLRGENDIRVINNSWGFRNQNVIIHKDIRDILKEFKAMVDLAERAGVQIVFAAGNEGEGAGFPKLGTLSVFGVDVDKLTGEEKTDLDYILEKVILVGAVNTQGAAEPEAHRLAEFSSTGDSLNRRTRPTVVAPGADMMVYGWDRYQGNPKALVNGTSFASPYVSGLIALMLQQNPQLSPADIRAILKETAQPLPGVPMSHQGAGEVSPADAVARAATYQSAVPQATRKRKADPPENIASGPSDRGEEGAHSSESSRERRLARTENFFRALSFSPDKPQAQAPLPKSSLWGGWGQRAFQRPAFQTTPSSPNRNAFTRGPSGWARMNPPKVLSLGSIR